MKRNRLMAYVAMLGLVSASASAQLVLDQSLDLENGAISVTEAENIAQSFTVGALASPAEPFLAQIWVHDYEPSYDIYPWTVTLTLRSGVAGVNPLTLPILSSVTQTFTISPHSTSDAGWFKFNLPNVPITSSSSYTFDLKAVSGKAVPGLKHTPDSYLGGSRYYSADGGTTWANISDQDLTFRTYVIPEPTATSLLLAGLVLTGLKRRFRPAIAPPRARGLRLSLMTAFLAIVGMTGGGRVANASLDTFETYSTGSLVGQGGWVTYSNYFGSIFGTDAAVGAGIGIGGSKSGSTSITFTPPTSGLNQAAVKPMDNNDATPGGDVIVRALTKVLVGGTAAGEFVGLVLGNSGIVNTIGPPLNDTWIYFNSGGDAGYNLNGVAANPKVTAQDFGPFGWVQVEAAVDADGGPDLTFVGLVTVSWRDVDDTTGAPIAPWTVLGTVKQSYGSPSYVGFFTTRGIIDNFEVVPEPSIAALLGVGSMLLLRRRRS